MSKNILIVIFVIIISFILNIGLLFTQQSRYTIEPKKDGLAYIFKDYTIIREYPDETSRPLLVLRIGEAINIIGNSEIKYTKNDITDYWYEIEKADISGYIWGAEIGDLVIYTNINYSAQLFTDDNVYNKEMPPYKIHHKPTIYEDTENENKTKKTDDPSTPIIENENNTSNIIENENNENLINKMPNNTNSNNENQDENNINSFDTFKDKEIEEKNNDNGKLKNKVPNNNKNNENNINSFDNPIKNENINENEKNVDSNPDKSTNTIDVYKDYTSTIDVYGGSGTDYTWFDYEPEINEKWRNELILTRNLTAYTIRYSCSPIETSYRYELKLIKRFELVNRYTMQSEIKKSYKRYKIYNQGFTPTVKLIAIEYENLSKEFNHKVGIDFFYIHNKKINFAFTYVPEERDCFTDIYFPTVEGGLTNKIIFKTTCDTPTNYTATYAYVWNGKRFHIE